MKPSAHTAAPAQAPQTVQAGKATERPNLEALRAQALKPWQAQLHGNRNALLLVIKATPGPAELAGKPPFFGEDGEALSRAFEQMGWGATGWCGLLLNKPGTGALQAKELRLLVETFDPQIIVAVDEQALEALQPVQPMRAGTIEQLWGRFFVFVNGFEAALSSAQAAEEKRRVWRELKALSPLLSPQ